MDEYFKVKKSDFEAVANAFRLRMGTSAAITFPGGFIEAAGWLPSGYSQLNAPELILNGDGTYTIFDENNGDFTESYMIMVKNASSGSEQVITIKKSETGTTVIDDAVLNSVISENGIIYELSATAWASEFKTSEYSNSVRCASYGVAINITGGSCDCPYTKLYSNRSGYTFTIIPNPNYSCPESIKVTCGGVEISDYSWEPSNGVILLTEPPTGRVVITVECDIAQMYSYKLLDDGTYEVSLSDGIVPEEPLVLPSEYNGKAVTQVGDFGSNAYVTKITIPSSIKTFIGLFSGYTALTEIVLEGDRGWKCTCADGEEHMNPSTLAMAELLTFMTRDDISRMEARPIFNITTKVVNGTHDNIVTWILGACEDLAFNVMPNTDYLTEGTYGTYWEYDGNTVTVKGSKIPLDAPGGTISIYIEMYHKYFSFTEEYGAAWVSGKSQSSVPAGIVMPIQHDFGAGAVNVRYISSAGFKDYTLLESVLFGEETGIVSINSGAFSGCVNLAEIILNNNIEKIGENALEGCKAIETILLPESVKYVEANAFLGCSNLWIYCEASSIPSTWSEDFNPDQLQIVKGYTAPYALYTSVKNGKINGVLPESIAYNEILVLQIKPDSGYDFPIDDANDLFMSVEGCKYTYSKQSGKLTLFKPYGAVSVSMSCVLGNYNFDIKIGTVNYPASSGIGIISYKVAEVSSTSYMDPISATESRTIKIRAKTLYTDSTKKYLLAVSAINADCSDLSEADAKGWQSFVISNAVGDVTVNVLSTGTASNTL